MIKKTLLAMAMSAVVVLPVAAEGYDKRDRNQAMTERMHDERMANRDMANRDIDREMVVDRDNAYITLTGTVLRTRPDSFLLDYGDGNVTVEMDDWDWYREGYRDLTGSVVTVKGTINEAWERGVIEADSIFARDRRTVYHAPATEAERWNVLELLPGHDAGTKVRGTVTAIQPRDRSIRVESGGVSFDVLTEKLAYDPINDGQPFEINVGDRIVVWGELTSQLPDNRASAERHRAVIAESLFLLDEDRSRRDSILARLDQEF